MAMALVRPDRKQPNQTKQKRKRKRTKENKSSNVWLGSLSLCLSLELGPSPTGRSVKLLMSLTFNITTNIYPVHVIYTFVFVFELNSQEWSFN